MMTSNKHFKQLVRARMAATGETYSIASDAVRASEADVVLTDPVVADVHGRHGQTVAFTPDGTRILSGGQDARVAILDATTGATEGELVGHDKVVNAVAIGGDANTVVSVSSDRTVRLWNLDERAVVAVLTGHRDAVTALDVAPDGVTALTGGYDGRIRVWDLDEHSCRSDWPSSLKRISAVAHTPDGALFVEAGQGPDVNVRDAETGSTVTQLDAASPGVIGLAVAPDGSMLATAGYDGTIGLWSCDDWQLLRQLRAGERANAVTFSRSGQLLAVAAKGRIAVWNATDDAPVADTTLPISGVYALALAPDGRRLAQTGADGRVRIWTLR